MASALEKYLVKEGKPGFKSAMNQKDKKAKGDPDIKGKSEKGKEEIEEDCAPAKGKKKREYMED